MNRLPGDVIFLVLSFLRGGLLSLVCKQWSVLHHLKYIQCRQVPSGDELISIRAHKPVSIDLDFRTAQTNSRELIRLLQEMCACETVNDFTLQIPSGHSLPAGAVLSELGQLTRANSLQRVLINLPSEGFMDTDPLDSARVVLWIQSLPLAHVQIFGLNLRGNKITDADIQGIIGTALRMSTLNIFRLGLSDGNISQEALSCLFQLQRLSGLTHINIAMDSLNIGDAGMQRVSAVSQISALKEVNIAVPSNNITADGILNLRNLTLLRNLRVLGLYLDDNFLSSEGVHVLSDILITLPIVSLILSLFRVGLSDEDVPFLARLQVMSSLKHIAVYLGSNDIGPVACMHLSTALQLVPRLERLSVWFPRVGTENERALFRLLVKPGIQCTFQFEN